MAKFDALAGQPRLSQASRISGGAVEDDESECSPIKEDKVLMEWRVRRELTARIAMK
jgi:hypothetical protein